MAELLLDINIAWRYYIPTNSAAEVAGILRDTYPEE
jgi:hypothetical protein